MRILHVISSLSPILGGPAVVTVSMAKAVASLGHEVIIHTTDLYCTDGAVLACDDAIGTGRLRIVIHKHAPFPALNRNASFGLLRALAAEIRRTDIVHLHSLYMFHDWATWRYCHRYNVPYILQPHGSLDPLIYARHRWRKLIAEKLFQNRVTSDAALIYFTTDTEYEMAKPYIYDRPGYVVPLGIDLDNFNNLPPPSRFRSRHPEIGARQIVLFLGRLSFKKGLDILIPAFSRAMQKDRNLHLVLAGGDDNFGAQARALTQRFGLDGHVTFTGHLNREGVIEAYGAASVFVLPSRSENFAIAAAEAMAAGVPCILSTDVQIASAAEKRGACRIAAPDIEAWSNAILDITSSPFIASEMSTRAKFHASDMFSWEPIARRLVALYERAL